LIGKAVKISRIENQTFTIRAILDKIPETSGINADIFINFDYHKNFGKWANVVGSTSAYIKVDDNSNINSVTKTSNKIKEELYSGTFEYYRKSGLSQKIAPFKVEFLNIKDVYLSNKFKGRIAYEKKNNLTNSYILISIALLILIISLINYIMLMLGSYTNRQKEIAIRKINGSKKKNLIVQFLIEISFSLIIAIVLSLFLTKLLTPIFNYLSNGNIFLSYLQSISLAIYYLLLYFIIISILIIPCYIITKHKPIEIFRNHNKVLNKDILAKTFIVIQFALSLILIISGFFIIKQVNHMKNRDVGFNPDNIIVLSLPYHYHLDKISLFQKLLNESPNIKTVARSDRDFVSGNSSYAVRNENLKKLNARNINIDSKYIDCLELDLIAGRNYTEQDLQNNNKVIIINQSFAKELGYKNPVGKYIYLGDSGNDKLQIIGVIKDFHIDSMKKNIEPLMLSSRSNFGNKIHKLFIKYDYSNIDKVITCMEKTWNKFEPQKGFGYAILKDMLSQQYQNEEKWSKTFIYIAIIALIISSMGLLGLTFLLLNRRVNEMGIRIVNGATISNLLIKINKEFLLYITISIVVSIPFIIYLSNKWLSGFAYKISNSYSVYILGGGIIIIFVISIVSYQTWRILSQNPVKALKYE
jgi:putative ABC transport system permease protein